ncbi:hypothetical protein BSKO_08931 [Bryopsis sp. KO-2023]|nr:hypothetical protein BSKO_08931 [Bryopsis sp. KO-2023]
MRFTSALSAKTAPLGRVASFRVFAEGKTPEGGSSPDVKVAAPKTVTVGDALAFSGPGPELINGRMAMIALPIAALLEVTSDKPTFELMANSPIQFAVVVALFSAASLIPILKGVESEPLGFMSPKAEMINGRAAMMGFASLLLIEAQAGAAFF